MNLHFNQSLAKNYHSEPQKVRVLSEAWVKENSYCTNCSAQSLAEFANNKPVADFYCENCNEQYELKSKKAKLSNVVNDGAYKTMIERINSKNNPSFFFLTYSKEYTVNNFLIIPKHFFTPDIIVKRKPLSVTAKRAGWVGCNIDLRQVPESGKVFLVKDQQVIPRENVTQQFQKTLFLRKQSMASRGWTLDVWQCIDRLDTHFSLKQVYGFADELQLKHPENNHVKDKIRQQLQVLRDKGIIEFVSRGHYRKLY
ncbi:MULTISPECIES: DpnI domain-containing protein [Psychrobacter]|jgi:type II restriction enzyme|uniref:DpnI domain-containing protein n=1 Tax=Psychrobacter TaxID=497 RepID=UPI000C32D7A7|nr:MULTISPECIES: DpnI domain-containing protein [Psychrobacter]MBA6244875.1 restriction endonuclease [Psychrobacter sp. Urea-trap-18]MBA6286420.1 restriction endonuclease [Psychrobacter sp. Urea-trap-16]MBA6318431.1 restriction endonuclease [Psychrobacter sp. Urea-trap-20]MBA6334652.1 restriction endonuclease [Psychrobacter sp. Urea-trap-19]PKG61294.1 restriction endonuclease [Psychrobacter sp. Choline-3u-12]|tara:strand:- start:801 stop:1565 length:765 start_codon:yes stop_codon:yes gene_type:complete